MSNKISKFIYLKLNPDSIPPPYLPSPSCPTSQAANTIHPAAQVKILASSSTLPFSLSSNFQQIILFNFQNTSRIWLARTTSTIATWTGSSCWSSCNTTSLGPLFPLPHCSHMIYSLPRSQSSLKKWKSHVAPLIKTLQGLLITLGINSQLSLPSKALQDLPLSTSQPHLLPVSPCLLYSSHTVCPCLSNFTCKLHTFALSAPSGWKVLLSHFYMPLPLSFANSPQMLLFREVFPVYLIFKNTTSPTPAPLLSALLSYFSSQHLTHLTIYVICLFAMPTRMSAPRGHNIVLFTAVFTTTKQCMGYSRCSINIFF